MNERREFLKGAIVFFPAAGVLTALAREAAAKETAGKETKYNPADHLYGMGIEIDKCIGCNRCAVACKMENDVPDEPFYFRTWVERYTITRDGEVTVEDIMVPRNEIFAIDLADDWNDIVKQLTTSQHTRVPVCQDGVDHVVGMLHIRNVLPLLTREDFGKDGLRAVLREPYFVPEGTPLNEQLLNFQRQKRRIGLMVDEYGDIQGLVTLEDILEEIVGEFTTAPSDTVKDVYPQEDGSFLVDGSANIRELNRTMHWKLPTDGPKTLNGLILEYLETIPEPGTSLRLSGYPIDIIQTTGNAVKIARIDPAHRQLPDEEEAAKT